MFSWITDSSASARRESRRGSAISNPGTDSPGFDVEPPFPHSSGQTPPVSYSLGEVGDVDGDGDEKLGRRGSAATTISFTSDDSSFSTNEYKPDPAVIRRHRRCIALFLSVVALLVIYLASTTELLSSTSATFSRLAGYSSLSSAAAASASPSNSSLDSSESTTSISETNGFTPSCPARTWSSGRWVPRLNASSSNSAEGAGSVWETTGWTGCAQSWFRNEWQLGLTSSPEEGRMSGYRARAGGWTWQAGGDEGECEAVEAAWEGDEEEQESVLRLLQDLVDRGGWLIVGDSLSEQHFFSLSCLLHPHVVASWPFEPMSEWKQIKVEHLHLNPESSFVKSGSLRLKEGWDREGTPMVSHVRSDHGLSPSELVSLAGTFSSLDPSVYPAITTVPPLSPPSSLLTPVESYSPTLDYILSFFLNPSQPRQIVAAAGEPSTLGPAYSAQNTPQAALDREQKATRSGKYRALIFSTGAHYSTRHFNLPTPDAALSSAAQVEFFQLALEHILARISVSLAGAGIAGGEGKEILIRPTSIGHDACHEAKGPVLDEKDWGSSWYSWPDMEKMSRKAEEIVSNLRHSKITYLDIDRPGKLRPDAHTNDDCLHLSSGTGVIEGWTHYLAQYLEEKGKWQDDQARSAGRGRWGWLNGWGW
ncbi:hypothetical protein JCM11641_000176 [Rhodosporidiobolus odoratus]